MTTARTHRRNVNRGAGATPLQGAARPRVSEQKPEDYVAPSAESFGLVATDTGSVDIEVPFDPADLDVDPADLSVADVKDYVERNPETAEAILELEESGKDRVSLTEWLGGFINPED